MAPSIISGSLWRIDCTPPGTASPYAKSDAKPKRTARCCFVGTEFESSQQVSVAQRFRGKDEVVHCEEVLRVIPKIGPLTLPILVKLIS